jgi:hypothetical protein
MDAFTPAQTTELVSRIGAKKARMRIDKMFINSFMGGALISFGCALALSTNSSPWFQVRIGGAVFFLLRSVSTGTHHLLSKCFLLRHFSEATTPNTSKKT